MPTLKGPQDGPNKPSAPIVVADTWSGSWGKINPSPQSAQTLRLYKGGSSSIDESYSYPYRTLSSWHWRRELQQEELKIEAGPDTVTIRGKGIVRLLDALDAGALETVRENSNVDVSSLDAAIVVKSLVIEKPGDS
jgi:hypothetical protein